METKARGETHSRDLGCCFHRHLLHVHSVFSCLQSPCTISWWLIFALKTFRWDWLLILFKKGASASIIRVSICIHRRHLGEWGWGWKWANLHALLYDKISNKNHIFPQLNYIIRKLYLLRRKKNQRFQSWVPYLSCTGPGQCIVVENKVEEYHWPHS